MEGNAQIAKNAYRAFNRGGVDAILEFLSPDIEWRMWEQFTRRSRVFFGHKGVREVLAMFEDTLDEFRAEPHEFIEEAEFIVVPVRLHGLTKGTGEAQSFEVVQVWQVREDRLAHRLDVYSELQEALDAVRSRGGESDPSKSSGAA